MVSREKSTLGEFEQIVLFSVLQLGKLRRGVAIREEIELRTGRQVSSGAIYTTLGRLEERGLVTSQATEATSGRAGRPRKQYVVGPAGARSLLDAYSAIQAMAKGQIPKLAKLAERRW